MNDRKNFFIAKVKIDKKEEKKKEKDLYEAEPFISPFSGYKVLDNKIVPGVNYDSRQYSGLRENEKITKETLIKQYGSNYYEETKRRQEENMVSRANKERSIPSYYQKEDYTKKEEGPIIATIKTKDVLSDPSFYEEPYENVPIPKEEDINYYNDYHKEKEEEEKTNFTNEHYSKPLEKETFSSSYDDIEIPLYKEKEEKEELPSYKIELLEEIKEKTYPIDERNNKKEETRLPVKKAKQKYQTPPLSLLKMDKTVKANDNSSCEYQRKIIDQTLSEFRIPAHVVNYTKGPTVTQFEIKLDSDSGIRVERVNGIARNLQMNLEVRAIRIQAPIPGKSTIGVEVPNMIQDKVMFGDLLSRPEFLNDGKVLNTVLGLDISGKPQYLNIQSMPHALVAGSTGSGKSVCVNSIITSILYKASPDDVKLILVDPKMIEFACYEDIPHLATPVINDPKIANQALKWAVEEMERRYMLFKKYRVNELSSFNEVAKEDPYLETLPYMVIIIDEFADLMSSCANTVEEYVQRLAQKSRACGIHLIIATQRPTTDVIKGTIKANIMTRIAFSVTSQVDSITILDHAGADKLLGKGDMLYCDGKAIVDLRVQGSFISLDEIKKVTDYIRSDNPKYMFSLEDLKEKAAYEESDNLDPMADDYFEAVARFVVENNAPSINRIQKKFQIGFNRAQLIMTGLESLNIVSEVLPNKTRTVLVTLDELEKILG